RQLLDDAIAPYIDTALERRVEQAKTKWYEEATAAVDAQIDAEAVQRVRDKVEQLQDWLDHAKDELAAATEDIDLPEVKVPQSAIDADHLDDARQAVIKFDTDWVTATNTLIARKRYLDNDEEE